MTTTGGPTPASGTDVTLRLLPHDRDLLMKAFNASGYETLSDFMLAHALVKTDPVRNAFRILVCELSACLSQLLNNDPETELDDEDRMFLFFEVRDAIAAIKAWEPDCCTPQTFAHLGGTCWLM